MFYKDRPRIKVPYSKKHKIIDILSLLGIVLMAGLGYLASLYMPEQVPVHFNIVGNPDGYGSPDFFLLGSYILTGILLFTWVSLSLLRLIPHYFNYPVDVEITEKNAGKQYQIGVDLMYTMKLCIVLTFLFIQIMMIYSAFSGKIGYVFLLVFPPLMMMFYFIRVSTLKSIKNK
ncbi:MAG: hypothetical protein A2044_02655 [Candidatus Firestonebacteria bacterium GWA2_43_8]|nr:MAG: hypothetical protein A2044_02655 [Candidatus Firestonebacteria bacterium GWA2_43_8]